MSDKVIKVIKEIRKKEEYHNLKASLCRDHNMELDAIKHSEIENELRRVCSLIQTEFGTGYIN